MEYFASNVASLQFSFNQGDLTTTSVEYLEKMEAFKEY